MPKPSPPPSVASLTNEARYLEWKWRMDVTDPATGVDKAKAKAKILDLSRELEPKEPWNVVKATCFAWLCDNVAIDVSPLDWERDRISLSIRQCQAKPLKPRTPEEIARDAEAQDVADWMEAHAGETDSFSSLGSAFDGLKL